MLVIVLKMAPRALSGAPVRTMDIGNVAMSAMLGQGEGRVGMGIGGTVDSTGGDSGGSAGGEPSGIGVDGGKASLGSKSSGREAEEGGCGSGCKTTGGGMNGASVVHVTAGAGASPSCRNGIASLLFSSGRLLDMGGGMARVAGDGVGGAFRALATTGVTASPRVQQKDLSMGVSGGPSGAGCNGVTGAGIGSIGRASLLGGIGGAADMTIGKGTCEMEAAGGVLTGDIRGVQGSDAGDD